MITFPEQIHTLTNSMTVEGVEYKLQNVRWTDREAWTNSTWIYQEATKLKKSTLQKEFEVWFYSSLNAIFPVPIGANSRSFLVFTVDGVTAGFYHMVYMHSLTGEKKVTDLRALVVDEFRGRHLYKYMYALGAYLTAVLEYPLEIQMMHAARGVRDELVRTNGMTKTDTYLADWDKTGTVWRHAWRSDPALVKQSIDDDPRFTEMTFVQSLTPISDPRWESPLVTKYLVGESQNQPDVNEGIL